MTISTRTESTILTCPNGHEHIVPAREETRCQSGLTYRTQSAENPDQNCPTCGPYTRNPDGTARIRHIVGIPRPIEWAVEALSAEILAAVPSEIERVKMVDDGRMRRALEQLRDAWEARGIVDYDEVIDAVVAREEFVAHTPA